MYTLRRISGNGVEMNFALGDSYTVVSKQSAPEEFEKNMNDFVDAYPGGEIYAFVWTVNGTDVYPLFKGQQAYVMTPGGCTLSNLTLRN